MSDPTDTVSTRTPTQHPASTRRGAVCNPRFRARTSGRDLHGLDTGPGQHCVERLGKLSGPIADQEPERRGAITQVHQEIADLLGGPRPVRVRGHPDDVHVAAAEIGRDRLAQGRQRLFPGPQPCGIARAILDTASTGSPPEAGLAAGPAPPGSARLRAQDDCYNATSSNLARQRAYFGLILASRHGRVRGPHQLVGAHTSAAL